MASDSDRLVKLVRSFHCLEECPLEYLAPQFRAADFATWAGGPELSGGGVHAALFILGIYNSRSDWDGFGLECGGRGHFVATHAIGNWDLAMREAFAAWTADPWYFG